jgi:hypothetical protein
MAMTNAEHTAAKNQIEADSKAAKDPCKPLKDPAQDVCEKQAKGQENVAKAELESRRNPSPRNSEKALNHCGAGSSQHCQGNQRFFHYELLQGLEGRRL